MPHERVGLLRCRDGLLQVGQVAGDGELLDGCARAEAGEVEPGHGGCFIVPCWRLVLKGVLPMRRPWAFARASLCSSIIDTESWATSEYIEGAASRDWSAATGLGYRDLRIQLRRLSSVLNAARPSAAAPSPWETR